MAELGLPGYVPPPRGIDLPTEDGIPLESNLHHLLADLLRESLELAWAGRDFFLGGNMFLYFSALQAKRNDFRGPDLFVVLETEHRQRDSWVVWEEDGKAPDLVLEITSETTAAIDRGDKKRIYGRVLRVPEYFIYDPLTRQLDGYRLDPAREYEPISTTAEGRAPSRRLGLELGLWRGRYQGYEETWLRWYGSGGQLLPTNEEARAHAEQERAHAEQRVAQQAARLADYERRFGPLGS